jgi:uncharacterized surface protein with fasciclin (FAS1) repeats
MLVKLRKKTVLIWSIVAVILIGGLFWILNSNFIEYQGLDMKPSKDVADNIISSPQDQEFARMIQSVGLDTFLHDQGPFTIFAPIDASYAKLPSDVTDKLSNPEEVGTIRQVVLYHVVKGKYLYKDLKDGMKLKTLEGDELLFTQRKDNWLINNHAYLINYDMVSTNGVIHTINTYLLP